jgi:hypothetical protein
MVDAELTMGLFGPHIRVGTNSPAEGHLSGALLNRTRRRAREYVANERKGRDSPRIFEANAETAAACIIASLGALRF